MFYKKNMFVHLWLMVTILVKLTKHNIEGGGGDGCETDSKQGSRIVTFWHVLLLILLLLLIKMGIFFNIIILIIKMLFNSILTRKFEYQQK